MEKNYIDVDYIECEGKKDKTDVNVNVNPVSTLIHEAVSGVFGVVNNVTNAIKEYNICRQQEETKRAEINAYLKIGLAEINAKKEVLIKQLANQQELNLQYLKDYHEMLMKELDLGLEATKAAIENAKVNNDFSNVIELMKINNAFIETRSEFTLQLMDRTNKSDSIKLICGNSQPKGYIE